MSFVVPFLVAFVGSLAVGVVGTCVGTIPAAVLFVVVLVAVTLLDS